VESGEWRVEGGGLGGGGEEVVCFRGDLSLFGCAQQHCVELEKHSAALRTFGPWGLDDPFTVERELLDPLAFPSPRQRNLVTTAKKKITGLRPESALSLSLSDGLGKMALRRMDARWVGLDLDG
jgi:hypothetical protein